MLRRTPLVLAFVMFASACTTEATVAPSDPNTPGNPGSPAGQFTSIAILDPGPITDGDVLTLHAVIRDRAGHIVSDVTPLWTSSDTSVAVVSSDGVLSARRAGSIELEASAEDTFGKVQVRRTVQVALHPATALQLSDVELTLPVGEVRGVHATVLGTDGRVLQHRVLAWTSTNPFVAKVNASGEILAVAAGTTTIAVRYGMLIGEVRVQVPQPPALSRYDVTSVNGQTPPAVVADWYDDTPTGPKHFITRVEGGVVRIGDPYEVRLQVVTYQLTELGGNTIISVVDRTTVTDAGTVYYDWLTGAATLQSTMTGGLEHALRTVGGKPVLQFRQAGSDTIWALGLTYVP